MNDLISRQDAIDRIREVYEYEYPTASGAFDEFVTVIIPNLLRNLPSADPERKKGKWIPVTEALLEEKKYVLVTTIDDDMKVSWVTDVNYWWNIGRGKVIAWMPLPEPWRGER